MNSGIYIHIPFCDKKCGYCDFYSVTDFDSKQEFLDSLEKEIILYAQEYNDGEIFDTIYLGGGTPSILSTNQIYKILNVLEQNFKFSSDPEITLETNPGKVSRLKLVEIKDAGINRLSIGVQSSR